MRWRGRRSSSNVIDRRGQSGGRRGGFGLGGGLGGGLGRGSLGRGSMGRLGGGGLLGLIILAAVIFLMESDFLDGGDSSSQPVGSAEEEELKQFVGVVLADTEDIWHALFEEQGRSYGEPHLVLFSGGVDSACGFAQSAVGPFYCPGDERVYLDLDFFGELSRRFGAPGDFAQAYVIAHEVGHHVQKELGILTQVHELQSRSSQTEANELSVRLELQADCLAGVFAHYADATKGVLEPGDIEEALGAAAAIGDDKLQRDATGTVRPDSFTHGTSAQRQRWFGKGYDEGRITACDSFTPATL